MSAFLQQKRAIRATVHAGGVNVTVEVWNRELTKNEIKRLADHVATGVMRVLEGAPYLSVPLSRIEVKNRRA